jgi:hypothetical protein
MENIDKDFNLIQDYLDGGLSSKETAQVQKRIAKDPNFARLHERSQKAIKAVRNEAENSTMAMLRNIQKTEVPKLNETRPTSKIRKITPFRMMSIAAVLLVLVVAAVWVFLPQDNSLSAFNEYYETPAFDLQRGGNAEALISTASSQYSAGDFQAALQSLEAYEQASGATTGTQLYRAIAHLEIDQNMEALEILNKLSSGADQLDQVYWLKALTLLKMEEPALATAALEQLLSDEVTITSSRRQKVEALLEELNK